MKIIHVSPIDTYKLHVTFDDGTEGNLSLTPSRTGSVFEQLEKNELWKYPKITQNGNAIYWNDELDIDSISCYIYITGINPFTD